MTDKELQRLRREDLLQILIGQQKQIQDLTEALESAENALADKRVKLDAAGSIAEAALQLNGVFEVAQRAADDYVAQTREQADDILAQARAKLEEAEQKNRQAEETLSATRTRADRILAEAQRNAGLKQAQEPEPEDDEPAAPRRRGLFGRGKRT